MRGIRFRLDDRTLMINNEQCAIITGFDKYAVSMHGNVYNIKTGRKLKPRKQHKGQQKQINGKLIYIGGKSKHYYFAVELYDSNGKPHNKRIHKLVAQEWLKDTELNPDGTPIVGKRCVNHIDHNTANNKVTNLEYCDYKYNQTH